MVLLGTIVTADEAEIIDVSARTDTNVKALPTIVVFIGNIDTNAAVLPSTVVFVANIDINVVALLIRLIDVVDFLNFRRGHFLIQAPIILMALNPGHIVLAVTIKTLNLTIGRRIWDEVLAEVFDVVYDTYIIVLDFSEVLVIVKVIGNIRSRLIALNNV